MHIFKWDKFNRIVSLILSVTLIFSFLPSAAFAAESPADTSTQTTFTNSESLQAGLSSQEASPTVVREIVSERDAYSRHYLLSDGTYEARISQNPVNYQDEQGAWKAIDTDLVYDSVNHDYATRSTQVAARFNSQSKTDTPAKLETDEYSIGIDMVNGTEATKTITDNAITFTDVARDSALEYEAQNNGLKETVILSSAAAPTTFSFDISLTGLEARETTSGAWGVYEPNASTPKYILGDLIVQDASRNKAGEPAYDADAKMDVEKTDKGLRVTYRVSKTWLESPERVFPVRVDPTLEKPASDTYISSKYPDTNYASADELKCGYYDSTTGYNRSLFKFSVTDLPDNAYIQSATFKVYQTHTYYVDTAKTTYLGLVKKTWDSSMTWSDLSCSKADENLFDPYASKSVSGRGVWLNWDVSTAVQDWASGDAVNKGFALYQQEGVTSQEPECWRKFSSANADSNKPELVVHYSDVTMSKPTFDRSTPSYAKGEEVKVTFKAYSGYIEDLTSQRFVIDESDGDGLGLKRGLIEWTPTAPDSASWSVSKASSSQGGRILFRI